MGVNIFTYILAGLILLFVTLNFVLGPGWLGQAMGIQGVGTFTNPDSITDTIDLGKSEYLL